jgi:hypothetical protein
MTGQAMRITRAALDRRWAITTGLAVAAFAVLALLDVRLRMLSQVGTADLQGYTQAWQYRAAAFAWSPIALAMRAGFALGFDYLFMPLYAASFFYSGIIAREAFAPRPSRLRRLLTLLAAVPIAGALLDGCENALELWILLGGASDPLPFIASTISGAKMVAVYVGLVLLAGAILAQVQERQKRKRDPR